MDHFSAPFSNSSSSPSSSSSPNMLNLAQPNMGAYPQNVNMGYPQNLDFTDNSGQHSLPEPYPVPLYNPNLQIQNVQYSLPEMNLPPPAYHIPTVQSSVAYEIENDPELQSLSPRKRTFVTTKNARNKRLQLLRQSRNSGPLAPPFVPQGIVGEHQSLTIGGSTVDISVKGNKKLLLSPDGKVLQEIMTKVLKNSDIGVLGRIVLPKRECELHLPALRNKGGIDLVFKDVDSDELLWIMRYKYWVNNKSRMYVLENTGDFVKHYGLVIGDSVILYEDEFKNLYVGSEKENDGENEAVPEPEPEPEPEPALNMEIMVPVEIEEVHEPEPANIEIMLAPFMQDEAEDLSFLTKEQYNKEAEAASSIFTPSTGGASSSAAMSDEVVKLELPKNAVEEAPNKATEEAAAASATVDGERKPSPEELQKTLEEFYATLESDVLQTGNNYPSHGFDHFPEYDSNLWP